MDWDTMNDNQTKKILRELIRHLGLTLTCCDVCGGLGITYDNVSTAKCIEPDCMGRGFRLKHRV